MAMKKRRNRLKQTTTLNHRLAEFGARLYAEAQRELPGSEQHSDLIKRAKRTETAIGLNDRFSRPEGSEQISSSLE
jgi:hypothetical protein